MRVRSMAIRGGAVFVAVLMATVSGRAVSAQGQPGAPAAGKAVMQVLPMRTTIESGPDRQMESLFTGPGRRLVQITLRNAVTLDAHKAPMPITIQCVAGSGVLRLPADGMTLTLTPGVLVTIDADVMHEIVASPSVSILLTQFTGQ